MNHRITQQSSRISLFISALLLLVPRLALAQEGKGAIVGKVTDQTGAVLRGAQVSIEAQDINTVSDEQGLFFVSGLTPGKYTLSISYVGFAQLSKTVDVAAGQRANVDAKLELQSQNQTVLVTAPRATAEAEARGAVTSTV